MKLRVYLHTCYTRARVCVCECMGTDLTRGNEQTQQSVIIKYVFKVQVVQQVLYLSHDNNVYERSMYLFRIIMWVGGMSESLLYHLCYVYCRKDILRVNFFREFFFFFFWLGKIFIFCKRVIPCNFFHFFYLLIVQIFFQILVLHLSYIYMWKKASFSGSKKNFSRLYDMPSDMPIISFFANFFEIFLFLGFKTSQIIDSWC